jgi:ATP-binding cassette subfamily F protein uup
MALAGFAARRLGRTVYDVEDVDFAVQTEEGPRSLFEHLTWHVGPGDRIGIVGVNGAGKTSLLKLLVGETRPDTGRVVVGQTVAPAYLSQHVTELPPRSRVLEAVQDVARIARIGNQEISASSLAERFGFAANRQWTPVGDLSGGERRRLQLMRLLMDEPNVLLLDEPTNDLDIDTLTALEDLLDGWPGTLVVVSHDRYFVERACDDVYALSPAGGIRHLPGGIEQYVAGLRDQESAPAAAAPAAPAKAPGGGGAARAARKEAARLERALERLEAREAALQEQMAGAATDHERLRELQAQLEALAAEREDLEGRWLEQSELGGA